MYDRFPELRGLPKGTPPEDGFLDGLFFIGGFCGLTYVIPLLGFAFYMTGLPYAGMLMGWLGLLVSVGTPILWAAFVPGGLWYMLLPIFTPVALLSLLLVRAGRDRVRTLVEMEEA